jgi:PPOX class probable F420-dependent enzyme
VAVFSGGARFVDGPRHLRTPLAAVYLGAYAAVGVLTLGHLPVFGSNLAFRRSTWLRVRGAVHRDADLHDDLDLAFHLGERARIRAPRGAAMGISMRPFADPAQFGRRWARGVRTVVRHWPRDFPPVRWNRLLLRRMLHPTPRDHDHRAGRGGRGNTVLARAAGFSEDSADREDHDMTTTSWESVRRYFDRGALAHLSTLLPDGSPHSVPVWVGVEEERLAVFMETDSRKDRNLQRDPRLALSTVNPEEPLDMATVRGRAVTRITGDEAMPIVDRIARLYTGADYDVRSGMTAYLIEPERSWANDYTAAD